MTTVYFETPNGSYSEQVAIFETEALYIACLENLEKQAESQGMIVTESVSSAVPIIIHNNIEFEKLANVEKELSSLAHCLEFDTECGATAFLIKEMESLAENIFEARKKYQLQKLKDAR